ncbi:MerR family transcriptional regulator [Enterococcus sp. AZ109]|uniref:MerR family transcriptional regulator n=1 Tax=Enterococcus sp. AZ109 TaxID=2774634 RepID=UPI003F2652DB
MLTISQFSKIAQITTKTLRYYDEIQLLKPAAIDPHNGYRYYRSNQMATVFLIQKLRNYECSLDEIKKILADPAQLKVTLERKQAEIDEKILTYTSLQTLIEKDLSALSDGELYRQHQEQIECVDSPQMTIFSVRRVLNVQDFSVLMTEVFETIAQDGMIPIGPPLSIYHSPEYTPDHYDMEFGVPVADPNDKTYELLSRPCAKLHYKGHYERLTEVYMQLSQWVEEQHLQVVGPAIELYVTDPNTTDPAENEVTIYLPIK